MKRFVLAAVLVVTVGCESGVDPYVGTAEPYTVWGVMNSAADTQMVRVFTIEGQPGVDRPDDPRAAVSSTNLTTGDRLEWRHRTASIDSVTTGHVYWAPFRAQEGHRYRLDIAHADGRVASAEVSMPAGVEIEIDTDEATSTLPVRITGDVPRLVGVEVRYEASNMPPDNVWPPDRAVHPPVQHAVDVSYSEELDRIADGWRFSIQMQRDAEIVRNEFAQNCLITEGNPGISLRRVELRLVAADSAWTPPGGVFDPETLVEPNAMSNVENGYGFLGAGQIARVRWTPPRDVRYAMGYTDDRPCSFQASPSPECSDPPIPCIGENPESIWEIYF